jgi:hypothetical protein
MEGELMLFPYVHGYSNYSYSGSQTFLLMAQNMVFLTLHGPYDVRDKRDGFHKYLAIHMTQMALMAPRKVPMAQIWAMAHSLGTTVFATGVTYL